MKQTTCGHLPHYAKGLCKKCYEASPLVKDKKRKYMKEYYARPETKVSKREYEKKYNAQPEVKAKKKEYFARSEVKTRLKEYRKYYRSFGYFVWLFFNRFKHNRAWQREGIEKMANLYATTTCELTKTQQCKLEEEILKKAKQ